MGERRKPVRFPLGKAIEPGIPPGTEVQNREGIMTFTFTTAGNEPLSLEGAIGQAIGAGSMCWKNVVGAGEFESVRAKEIAEALLAFVLQTGRRPCKRRRSRPEPISGLRRK